MGFYDSIAKGYKELHGEEQKIKLNLIKQNLDIKDTDKLLDVGCGIGSDFNCSVIGIDPSIELLKQNNNNNILAIAETIPFKDNSFDKVISVTAMHNFDNIKTGIKEMNRVGKKDFAFSILKKSALFNPIEKEINKNFNIIKIIEEEKDRIFICSKIFK